MSTVILTAAQAENQFCDLSRRDFTDRSEYLAWVAAWKAANKEMIVAIRRNRKAMRDPQNQATSAHRDATHARIRLREIARQMYELRAANKLKACDLMRKAAAAPIDKAA